MDVADLKAKIAEAQANGEQIMAIVATAGTTDAGRYRPTACYRRRSGGTSDLAARGCGMGRALLLSEQYRDYSGRALSAWTPLPLDFHKQFFPDHQAAARSC
ncbi:L-2,4-diaminobutyrate decarboxylase [Raoultella planticola]|uniref:L-2,4-diaminobutyrate decarboxylase n=1 Tax=Raoultella planticola TaxID=575 RepID=A0A485CVG8_RAOPL|nr:L-2,4-diaminobutyrate decarboxylase [Raoultella planticola]